MSSTQLWIITFLIPSLASHSVHRNRLNTQFWTARHRKYVTPIFCAGWAFSQNIARVFTAKWRRLRKSYCASWDQYLAGLAKPDYVLLTVTFGTWIFIFIFLFCCEPLTFQKHMHNGVTYFLWFNQAGMVNILHMCLRCTCVPSPLNNPTSAYSSLLWLHFTPLASTAPCHGSTWVHLPLHYCAMTSSDSTCLYFTLPWLSSFMVCSKSRHYVLELPLCVVCLYILMIGHD